MFEKTKRKLALCEKIEKREKWNRLVVFMFNIWYTVITTMNASKNASKEVPYDITGTIQMQTLLPLLSTICSPKQVADLQLALEKADEYLANPKR